MRIGIQDIDGHNFPNFALMRIAAFHRLKGDSVEMATPLFGEYDRIYQSKIFTFSPDNTTPWPCEVIKGGTGYDIASRLPDEIEQSTAMDYNFAAWVNKPQIFGRVPDFADFEPRKGFFCSSYLNT